MPARKVLDTRPCSRQYGPIKRTKVSLQKMDQVAIGADFLLLDPATAPARGLTDWLVNALRSAIDDGRMGPGSRLPATRALSADLAVSRGVVVEAYRRLTDEGLVGGRSGGGTTVLDQPARMPRSRAQPAASSAGPPRLPLPRLPIGEGIDLSPGVPDLSAFPRSLWLRTERAVLTETPPEELGYGDPRGHPRLRAALAPWLARTRGLRAGPDDIVVVSGVAQAMALLAQQLRREGVDSIAVEDPGSRGAVDEFAYWGLRPVPVPVDDDGIQVDALADTAARAVFLTPAHQFPTGVVLAPQRRRELLAWAFDAELVIEDDYDAEYRYDRAPVAARRPPRPTASSTPEAHRRASRRRCGWAGWWRRVAATRTWWRPNTPAIWAARPCPNSCWPDCWKPASMTGTSAWSGRGTGPAATRCWTRSSRCCPALR